MRIRPGGPQDAATIARLIRRLAEFERLSGEVTMDEAALAAGLFGPRPYAETLIAEEGGAAAGFALYFHTFSTFLGRPGIHLEDLFVLPEMRGRGIGIALMRELAGIALERGCGRLEWSVLDWNRDAVGFYERLGARPHRGWTAYRVAGGALARLAGPGRGEAEAPVS
ncbi:MAG: GNAT family N-acetyltransferase [Candidatus Dormibacterales bacterium]